MKKIIFVLVICSFFFTTTVSAEEIVVPLTDSSVYFEVPKTNLLLGLAADDDKECNLSHILYQTNPQSKEVEDTLSDTSVFIARGKVAATRVGGKYIVIICKKDGSMVATSPFPIKTMQK